MDGEVEMKLVGRNGNTIINFQAPFWQNLKVIVGFLMFIYLCGVMESL